MAVILAMAAIVAWAFLSGQVAYVVTEGVSMNPVYYQGDLVFTVRVDSYQVGQIAAYHGSQPGQKILHRIIGGTGDAGFVFKGDNNQSIDPLKPRADELIGRAVLHVPKVGTWVKPLLGPSGLGMLSFLIVGSRAATARTRRDVPRGRRKKKVNTMARGGGPWAAATAMIKAVKRLPNPLRVTAVVLAVVAVFGVALGVVGWLKPVIQLKKANTALDQSVTFSYTAKVRPTAAYDGTTVTSPDPIFRRVTDRIELRTTYHGQPGWLGLRAELSNQAGWHSTVPLLPTRSFTSTDYAATVPLDLAPLQRRADAATTAIGVQPSTVAVTIVADVVAAGREPFVASLNLSLSPLQLVLASGSPLSVKNTGANPVKAWEVRKLAIFGHPLMTAGQARSYAVFLLLVALVGAVVILLLAFRQLPVRTRAEIERRFPQLLVHVEPMASPPGKPVVTVDNFPALVKLAERYGQMILTWRRPDADDFVVRDEGITYRYRALLDEPHLLNVDRIGSPATTEGHHQRAASDMS